MRHSRSQVTARFRGVLLASVAGGAVLLASFGHGSTAHAETLAEALAAAYQYNPRLDAERARLRATDEDVARAMSGFRPQITGSADIGHNRTKTDPPGTSDVTNPKGYQVDLVQPVFTGLQTVNAVAESEASVRAGREGLRNIEQIVLLEAVTAYMDVIRDQAIVRSREKNVSVLTNELNATQTRLSVGDATRTDVAQAQARRAGAVSALDVARANLKTSRAAFERVIGHAPNDLREPAGLERLVPKSIEEAIAIGQQENPLLIAALYREQAGRHTVDRIRGELLPQVQLEANFTDRFDQGVGIDETESASVTGRLTVPIYQGGEVHARVRQAKHLHVGQIQEIEQVRTETQEDIVAAWSVLMGTRAQIQSDQSQVAANQTALAGVREEERADQRTVIEVLNAELELVESQVGLATTRRNLVVNTYTLLAAIGRLDALNLGVSSVVYDPEIHAQEVRRQWWGISITHADGRVEERQIEPSATDAEPVK